MPKPRTREALDAYAELPGLPPGFIEGWAKKFMARSHYGERLMTTNDFDDMIVDMLDEAIPHIYGFGGRSEVVTNLVAGVTDGVILIGGDFDRGVGRWIMSIRITEGEPEVLQVNRDYKYKVSKDRLTATKIR